MPPTKAAVERESGGKEFSTTANAKHDADALAGFNGLLTWNSPTPLKLTSKVLAAPVSRTVGG
jgi:hypothetical protein